MWGGFRGLFNMAQGYSLLKYSITSDSSEHKNALATFLAHAMILLKS